MYDVVHVLKRLRDNFLDHGFIFRGTFINKSMLERLLEAIGKSDLRISHKLSEAHINVKKQDRQNVRLCCELFSKSTVDAIRLLFSHDSEMLDLADFIELVDRWFDCMNRYSNTTMIGLEISG